MIARELWEDLKGYLKVDAQMDVPTDANQGTPVPVRVTVTNTAPSTSDMPRVVFDDISLVVTTTGPMRSRMNRPLIPRQLSSGESGTVEIELRNEYLPHAEFRIAARVSHRDFFQVGRVIQVSGVS